MHKQTPRMAAAVLAGAITFASAESLDLSGAWRFALDPDDQVINAAPGEWRFTAAIQLPGCLQAQGFGAKPAINAPWTGNEWRYPQLFPEGQSDADFKYPFGLQPPRLYVGPAWYQREIGIPASWQGRHVALHLERVHWQSTVWIDDRKVGSCNSLGTPHEFDLAGLTPGKHTLTLRVDNRLAPVNPGPLSHSVTDATQGNWNGVVGAIELRATPQARITRLDIHPQAATGTVRVRIHAEGAKPGAGASLTLRCRAPGPNRTDREIHSGSFPIAGPVTERELTIPKPMLWDEFQPHLYQLEAVLESGASRHRLVRRFGFRDLAVKDGRIAINGRKTFLRGTLECCIFPLTGHPPTDPASWMRIIGICQAHGLNHMRFHSWCPPEAAFAAADELGFYLQPEVSSWANQGSEIGSGRPLDAWIEEETSRMLAAYGHHPSFVLLAYGNEPAGPNHAAWLRDWVARWKLRDPLRLYTTGAGWPVAPGSDWHSSPDPRLQGWGEGLRSILNAQVPGTDFDWSERVAKFPPGATISHEIGQWCVYPDFNEIPKYSGYFKAKNFELFRDQAKRHGLLDQAGDFLRASGKLQVLAYKHDIEAALRTPGFGGFQLLDLHDFPGQGTALVGVLDAFWDSKPYCTPAEYARFCAPTVPLLRTKRFVLTTADTLDADVLLAHFGPADLAAEEITCQLIHEGQPVFRKSWNAGRRATGELHEIGKLAVDLSKMPAPAKLTLHLTAKTAKAGNSWDFFLYPGEPNPPTAQPSVVIHSALPDTLAALAQGKSVLWTPPAHRVRDDPARHLVGGFSPIFWNTAWTGWQAPHTLGLLCDPSHPALADFPSDSHSNWQWWEIVTGAQPFILTRLADLKPVVQPIDDWFTNRKLGLVVEARVGPGKLIACAADLSGRLDQRPAARQLRHSLLAYMAGDRFNPTATLTAADLEAITSPPPVLAVLGATLTASSSEPGSPVGHVFDGDPATFWHSEHSARKPLPPHEIAISLTKPLAIRAIKVTQCADGRPTHQVREIEILAADDATITRATIPRNARNHLVPLPAAVTTGKLTFRILTSHGMPDVTLAELDVVPAE